MTENIGINSPLDTPPTKTGSNKYSDLSLGHLTFSAVDLMTEWVYYDGVLIGQIQFEPLRTVYIPNEGPFEDVAGYRIAWLVQCAVDDGIL